ncbi:MAG: caspase family protein, partial [Thermoguttaceae bacterium]|nr:caspase family protein [Thermoguttaceae bacterium]
MKFGLNNGRGWATRLAVAALAPATTLVWGASVSASTGIRLYDVDGNVAFAGTVDCERTAASVKEGAEKPTTVFWTFDDLKGAYPYAALSEASKADVDSLMAEYDAARAAAFVAGKENWSKASTLPLGFTEVCGNRVALVVGCGDDNADGANPSSAADARLLDERLRERGFEVVLLTGQEATRSNIEGALKTLEEKTKADDMIFVAFSGRGLERNGEIYCLPTEVLNLPVNDMAKEVEEKCVSLSDFAQNLEKRTPGRRKAFFFDLCRGRSEDDVVDGAASLPANALTLCACASGEFALNADFDGKEHGIFSYYFAEG